MTADGSIYVTEGITREQLWTTFQAEKHLPGTHPRVCRRIWWPYFEGERPWQHAVCDIAMPSATQNEIDGDDAAPSSPTAVSPSAKAPTCHRHPKPSRVPSAHILYAPGKAANAEAYRFRSRNGPELTKLNWSSEEVDRN